MEFCCKLLNQWVAPREAAHARPKGRHRRRGVAPADNPSLMFAEMDDGSIGIIEHESKDIFSIRFCPFCGAKLPETAWKVGEWIIATDTRWYSFDERSDLGSFLDNNVILPKLQRTIENFVKRHPDSLEKLNPHALHEVLQVCATHDDPELSALRLLENFTASNIIALAMLHQTVASIPSFRDIYFAKLGGEPVIVVETYLGSTVNKIVDEFTEIARTASNKVRRLAAKAALEADIEFVTPEPIERRPPSAWERKPDLDKLRGLPGFIDDFDGRYTEIRVFRYAVPDPFRDAVWEFLKRQRGSSERSLRARRHKD